jgi:hypothetical protein
LELAVKVFTAEVLLEPAVIPLFTTGSNVHMAYALGVLEPEVVHQNR